MPERLEPAHAQSGFQSWQALLSTLFGLAVITLIGVGIRQVLDLDPVPTDLSIPQQGPAWPSASRGKGEGGARNDAKQGGGGGMGGGASAGAGLGPGANLAVDDERNAQRQATRTRDAGHRPERVARVVVQIPRVASAIVRPAPVQSFAKTHPVRSRKPVSVRSLDPGGRGPDPYQIFTRLPAGRTIVSPSRQENAAANSGMFDGAPIAR